MPHRAVFVLVVIRPIPSPSPHGPNAASKFRYSNKCVTNKIEICGYQMKCFIQTRPNDTFLCHITSINRSNKIMFIMQSSTDLMVLLESFLGLPLNVNLRWPLKNTFHLIAREWFILRHTKKILISFRYYYHTWLKSYKIIHLWSFILT